MDDEVSVGVFSASCLELVDAPIERVAVIAP
jgi:hypothetical protein